VSAQETKVAVEPRLIKALGHPLRQRVLQALNEGVASPSELSKKLSEPLGNVSYHVKILAECDAIELVKTAPVRGAVEHFYRATIRPYFDDDSWADLPESARRALFDDSLQSIWNHLAEAAKAGTLGNDLKDHVSWTTLEFDEQAYEEMAEQLRITLERAIELQAESIGRLADLPADERETHRTELAIVHFHRAPAGSGG
jgi:DNA-binding transcriptional ArsR family regulator